MSAFFCVIAPAVALIIGLALVCWITRRPNPLDEGCDYLSDCERPAPTMINRIHSSTLAQGVQHDHA